MPTRQTLDPGVPPRETSQESQRKTIPASKVGVTLTISDRARRELDKIREETIKAVQAGEKFSWR